MEAQIIVQGVSIAGVLGLAFSSGVLYNKVSKLEDHAAHCSKIREEDTTRETIVRIETKIETLSEQFRELRSDVRKLSASSFRKVTFEELSEDN